MKSKQYPSPKSIFFPIKPSKFFFPTLSLAALLFFIFPAIQFPPETPFTGDLRDANFPWNKLCFGSPPEKLKIAVFSKTWPVDAGAGPGGMERHAATLYTALAAKGHEIHIFTAASDRRRHRDIHVSGLHVHFAVNDHGSVNCSLAFDILHRENAVNWPFDYVHTESVSLPYWRARVLPDVAVTWHGIWYEIMHSKLFQELISNPTGSLPGPNTELQEAMPRLIDEIRFFSNYKQHICISNSAGEVLVNVYQVPQKNVHVILNGVARPGLYLTRIRVLGSGKNTGYPVTSIS